jgi:UDP-N-acetylmuramyl pentapeptide synthase
MTALAAKLNSPQYLGYWETVGDDLLSEIKAILQPGDTLLVKGSNRVFWAVGFVDKLREALSADQ